MPLVLDTDSGYNIKRRYTLSPDWKLFLIPSLPVPGLEYYNVIPIPIAHVVKLRIRLNETLYRVMFFVVYNQNFLIILGTQFMNKYYRYIL